LILVPKVADAKGRVASASAALVDVLFTTKVGDAFVTGSTV
jgi:hypothetical protein